MFLSHLKICLEKSNLMFFSSFKVGEPNNVGDLEKQPFYQFLKNTYIWHPVALAAALYAMGGFPFIVWGMVCYFAF